MDRLRRSSKPLFNVAVAANVRIVIFASAAIALMTLDHRYQYLGSVRDVLATAVYPLQFAAQLPASAIQSLSQGVSSRQELLAEIERLRQSQLLINAQLQKLSTLEAENQRLRMLLESSAVLRERVLIAELMTVDSDPYRHQILLNKGRQHGVQVGQPLIDQHGIVGQVIHANPLTSTAILVTDPNHALPVQIDRNGLRTLARGTGRFSELDLPHLPNNYDVNIGDLLVTSGLGGRFPRGYPVAKITRVEFDPGHPFARITAQPTAQLDRVREVLLVISEPLLLPPAMNPVESAAATGPDEPL